MYMYIHMQLCVCVYVHYNAYVNAHACPCEASPPQVATIVASTHITKSALSRCLRTVRASPQAVAVLQIGGDDLGASKSQAAGPKKGNLEFHFHTALALI